VAQQFADVGDAVFDHSGAFEGEAPAVDAHVLREAHGLQHFGPEHAAVADFYDFVEALVCLGG
jgi:hypothetical protein